MKCVRALYQSIVSNFIRFRSNRNWFVSENYCTLTQFIWIDFHRIANWTSSMPTCGSFNPKTSLLTTLELEIELKKYYAIFLFKEQFDLRSIWFQTSCWEDILLNVILWFLQLIKKLFQLKDHMSKQEIVSKTNIE